jgi:transcription factor C subunit 3
MTKLDSLGDQLLTRAIAELQEEKMIVHNFRGRDHLDERNYHLAEQYSTVNPKRSTLVRHLQRDHFIEAIEFKRKLDQLFVHENEDERVCVVPELVRDGEILCITELMAHGRVRILHKLPEINSTLGEQSRRITVWGGISGDVSYNYLGGKHVDKELLKWGVEIRPTERYSMGFPLEETVTSVEPPMAPKSDEKGRERIPFWVDVHGGFLKENWENVMLAVVYCVAVRAGSTVETITKSLKGIMWEWEIELVMDWLVEVCLTSWSSESGRKDRISKEKVGAIANEWWWTLLAGAETA